jgi:hypothetical protein
MNNSTKRTKTISSIILIGTISLLNLFSVVHSQSYNGNNNMLITGMTDGRLSGSVWGPSYSFPYEYGSHSGFRSEMGGGIKTIKTCKIQSAYELEKCMNETSSGAKVRGIITVGATAFFGFTATPAGGAVIGGILAADTADTYSKDTNRCTRENTVRETDCV